MDDSTFGSGELTPDIVRTRRFSSVGGGYSQVEVDEFLEQLASAVDVLLSKDVSGAMRRELQRNAEISSRVVLAGQETAERLRAQAADDARSIIDDTKRLAEQLRDASREEVERTREHIDQMRRTFIDELRDMYDRVGATLYRFDSASRMHDLEGEDPGTATAHMAADADLPPAPSHANNVAVAHTSHSSDLPSSPSQDLDSASRDDGWSGPDLEPHAPPEADTPQETDALQAADAPEPTDASASAGLEPAWKQLPSEAFAEADDAHLGDEAFEDEPLAEGEPLVDLRELQAQEEAAAAEAIAATIAAAMGEPFVAPLAETPADELSADAPPAVEDPAAEAANATVEAEVSPVQDDQRAEALIAGLDRVLAHDAAAPPSPESQPAPEQPPLPPEPQLVAPEPTPLPPEPQLSPEPPALPQPPSLQPAGAAQQADPQAVQNLVLQALHEGQPRDVVEQYLREQFGIMDPGGYINQLVGVPGAP